MRFERVAGHAGAPSTARRMPSPKPASTDRAGQPLPHRPDPRSVVCLQRTLGNQAVQRALRRGSADPAEKCSCGSSGREQASIDSPSAAPEAVAGEQEQADLRSPKYAGNPRLEAAFDNRPAMRIFETGEAVRLVQEGLVDAGFALPGSTGPDGKLDGIFGSETLGAVRGFQSRQGLTRDGVVGHETMGRLDQLALGTGPELPECADGSVPVSAASAFAGQPFAASSFIPPVPCTPKTTAGKDARDCARVQNPTLTVTRTQPVVRNAAGSGVVNVGTFLAARGAATVAGPDADQFEFGFIQVCRPYDVIRATYRKLGAAPRANSDANVDVSSDVRAVLPRHDHNGVFSTSAKGKPPSSRVGVTFTDTPGQHFPDRIVFQSSAHEITGLVWQSFWFLAFCVKLPSGTVRPLQTLYWEAKHCEHLTSASLLTTGQTPLIVHTPADRCIACANNCSASEPGFHPGSSGASCNDVVLPLANLDVRAMVGTLPLAGPGNFEINCD
jgi:peptidoglycan hydrolase-like protein with peptidoglycan-binding domain